MGKNENSIFCTKCGTENNKVNSFCLNCGNELAQEKLEYINSNTNKSVNANATKYTQINKLDTSLNNINIDEMSMFISKNTEYYNLKFNQITTTGNKITWNWATFFLDIYWFLYRKMYVQVGIIVLISIVSSILPIVGVIVNLGMRIGLSMYANSIYLDHVNKKLNEINVMGYEPKETMIMKKGGVNIIIPLIILGIEIVIGIFIGLLLVSYM